jgi:hypothetical protein
MNQQYILVYGNIADGLTFLGPYADAEEAAAYAEAFLDGENWDVIELHAPPPMNTDD